MITLTNACPRPIPLAPVQAWPPCRHRSRWRGVALAVIALASLAARADVLELKNGQVINGGEGAGKGAAIGAVASGLKQGEAVVIPPGALLEFPLQQPFTVAR